MTIHTTIERITPAQAENYLALNTTNRKMRELHVDKLADDISEGRWYINGASIVFNGDGTLLDGQHRLAAIIKAGVPVDMVVVRGVSKAAMATIDANVPRKANDVAAMRGYSNTAQLVGTVRLLYILKTGSVRNGERISHGAMMEFLRMHPHLQDSVTLATRMQKTLPVTIIASWHYLTFYVGGMHDDVARAVSVLESGIPAYSGDAIHVFRERALKDRKSLQGSLSNRIRAIWTLALAWNDFHARLPRSLCRLQQTEILFDGVDYSKL